jgi:GTP pyrophosphokinase
MTELEQKTLASKTDEQALDDTVERGRSMAQSIYGSCTDDLPKAMALLVDWVERYNAQYRKRYGEGAYEHFLYRVKSEGSMREKCVRKGLPVTPHSALREIHDAIGLRIVCNFVDDIESPIRRQP